MGDWRVKYDGVCSRCGIALLTGEVAVYDRPTRTIHCVSCPTAADPEPQAIDAGVAGRSARQEHDRRATKRETAVKERWGNRIGGAVLALTDEPQSTRAWAVGARGEEKLAEALDGFSVLHDRRVPGTRGNIDHIVVAPAGVFVVDAKRYEGRIGPQPRLVPAARRAPPRRAEGLLRPRGQDGVAGRRGRGPRGGTAGEVADQRNPSMVPQD